MILEIMSRINFRVFAFHPKKCMSIILYSAGFCFFIWNISFFANIKDLQPVSFGGKLNATVLNPHNFQYIIQQLNICDSTNGNVYLLIVVCVSPSRDKRRKAIRTTWGSIAKKDTDVRLIFMLGKTENLKIQTKVYRESNLYHDIIQEDFIDSYKNLSLKSVAMLKWVYRFCPSADYILKVDDDVFVNMKILLRHLKQMHYENAIIGAKLNENVHKRNKKSTWYRLRNGLEIAALSEHCHGHAYIITADVVKQLFDASLFSARFWIEEVYITGILRSYIKANLINHPYFSFEKSKTSSCAFRNHIVNGHGYNSTELRHIWKGFKNKTRKCDASFFLHVFSKT